MKLGIIARSDNTGLGNQTRELAKMLLPSKILLINSESFNKNKQHPEWYSGYSNVTEINGFPNDKETLSFLTGLDAVLSCETFYNVGLIESAHNLGVKTMLQYNYEFLDHLSRPNRRLPDMLISPSYWNLEYIERKFGRKTKVIYLPPPTDEALFSDAKNINMSKSHNRILHIAGKAAAKDRNGTQTVIDMMKHSKKDFELVIKTQSKLEYRINDSRITVDYSNPDNREEMYSGYDAMVLPRRYAGLCLPMNESLLSGLPVFMTDISPNNQVLPKEWLAQSSKMDDLMTRTMIDVYKADPVHLANIVDEYMSSNKTQDKQKAYDIGYNNYSSSILKDKYLDMLK